MIEHLHTFVALTTVLGSDWTNCFASVTDVVHRIVDVIVVSPGSRVTNLDKKWDDRGILCKACLTFIMF